LVYEQIKDSYLWLQYLNNNAWDGLSIIETLFSWKQIKLWEIFCKYVKALYDLLKKFSIRK
jgi:hypothetical protein